MLLQKDFNPALNTVTAYGDHHLEINRVRFDTAVCFGPQGAVRQLEALSLAQLDADFLRGLVGLDAAASDPMAFLDDSPPSLPADAPDVLIIGTGSRHCFLPPEVTGPLIKLGIGVETMTTHAAARTYNILMSEERRVLALLLPGDSQP